MKVKIVNARDVRKGIPQTSLFHSNTLDPSSTPKGMRLKRAIQALMAVPNSAVILKNGPDEYNAKMMNVIESATFVKGPARAVFPPIFLLTGPVIITAPGEIILKNGETIESKVRSTPNMVNRNSAHNPKCCAASLWASSCKRKEEVKTAAKITKNLVSKFRR